MMTKSALTPPEPKNHGFSLLPGTWIIGLISKLDGSDMNEPYLENFDFFLKSCFTSDFDYKISEVSNLIPISEFRIIV